MRKLELEELDRLSYEAYREKTKLPLVVVLDNIRSSYNVGAVFRTADAFLVSQLYLCGITATPPHREIQKTAIGATQSVNWEYRDSVEEACRDLKSAGYEIIGVEQTDESLPLNDFAVNHNHSYALVMGNEVEGLHTDILPFLDAAVEIPQFGTKHSLNIAVSSGIVMWHFLAGNLTGNH
jgi:23S rRNA (guanosine2251-2'-O)-methyltransferase